MTRWEYKRIAVSNRPMSVDNLNVYGNEGWQLVSENQSPGGQFHDPSYVYLFKRAVKEEA